MESILDDITNAAEFKPATALKTKTQLEALPVRGLRNGSDVGIAQAIAHDLVTHFDGRVVFAEADVPRSGVRVRRNLRR
ncbi:MAG: hypothetical protein WCJ64_11940, partial [Rhodospirillaceae bacterium]